MIPRPLPSAGIGLPLAGSEIVRFDRVMGEAGPLGLEVLSDRDLDLLTAARAPVAGLDLSSPRVMGILNVTPDSFSDGGDLSTIEKIVERAKRMAGEADILDIGGESTRPGAAEVPLREEIDRVAPAIRAIREAGITTPISVDTRKAAVAEAALDAGADLVNDVTAMRFDPDMAGLVAARGVPVCLMHSVADPETMQQHAQYDDVVASVFDHLAERISAAEQAGIPLSRIVVDPGIGFGKTMQHNLRLLRELTLYHALGAAILVGASRKRFIGDLGDAPEAKDRLGGSLAVALHAAANGAQILRVHDTYETRQALRLHLALDGRGE
ncbi:dihydropteroate synthase [Pelagovum pacificum]|uniref:Dihydropteroate synthase n=1 Tax=Pelagovum pacificum TaxID=2588711 RepID=A0A5C5GGH8_9RHOB|nr:dihydropteroate synthase [Pelagovum pacificum]QQA43722.1 dihydropteroate synthase [Pelagovum pacificum]TNY33147.1 dihydropteroate synthase [Pelagovum pacificum]